MPRDMTRTQRSMARRWVVRNPWVMRTTRAVLATRSCSRSVLDDDSRAPSSRENGATSPRPVTTSMKRSENVRFCAGESAGSSSMVSAIRQSAYTLPTTSRSAPGSCGMFRAKVRETPCRISDW